jgi:hypothetical protein
MAAVADLRPANAHEVRLVVEPATQLDPVVAADAHAMDCLRVAAQHCDEILAALRCRAQAFHRA